MIELINNNIFNYDTVIVNEELDYKYTVEVTGLYSEWYERYPNKEDRKNLVCQDCKAYQMHQYLQQHGQILGKGLDLEKVMLQIEADNVVMLEIVKALNTVLENTPECMNITLDVFREPVRDALFNHSLK